VTQLRSISARIVRCTIPTETYTPIISGTVSISAETSDSALPGPQQVPGETHVGTQARHAALRSFIRLRSEFVGTGI